MTTVPPHKGRLAMALGAILTLGAAFLTGQPQARVVLSDDTVIADLGSGQAYSDALRAAVQAQRAAPGDAEAALAAARLMIDEGRAKGDSRLVGAAFSILAPFVEAKLPVALSLAATARQYQHDFPGALALLDAALAANPRDVNTLLSRATIRTVQGDYPTALQDCARIAAARADVGFLCQATALTLTPDAPAIAARLTAILAQPGALDPALIPWATSLLGEIALLQGNPAMAEAHLASALAADPGAQREQLMLADILLDQGRAEEVDTLLQSAPDTDGVLIRRVLAARAQGRDLPDTVTLLATRAQRSLDLGFVAHAREEAMFYLFIAGDPAQALERAQANWALQHEYDDARLLIAAADAAGKPDAAWPVLTWMQEAGVDIPALTIPSSITALTPP
jgi:tetratricopeptide (TPR) repeat protein